MSHLFIIGMPACGKSTFSKKLSKVIKMPLIDLDHYIEKKAGKSVQNIFQEQGEDPFRKLEHESLLELIGFPNSHIIATGGGTPAFFNNMELMNHAGKTIYLKKSVTTLIENMRNDKKNIRPLLLGASEQELRQKLTVLNEKREAFYKKASLIIVENDLNPIEHVIQAFELSV